MDCDRQQKLQEVLVFALLIAIGVAGRNKFLQPEWCFTPVAAAAIFAGFYFSRAAIAAMVPLAIMVISDLVEPAYDNLPVLLATYGVMAGSVLLGKLLRGNHSTWSLVGRWAACGLLPATLFFLVTNFMVWGFKSDYAKTLDGLSQCYLQAVPFFRSMVAGDVFYLVVLFTCAAMAGVRFSSRQQVATSSVF